jgi:hypothetical protein
MRRQVEKRHRGELFEAALASGIGQALADWATEYTHDLLERNPELRARLRAHWRAMYEIIAAMDEPPAPRRRRGRHAAT